MAEFVVGPIMEKIINACADYLEDQVGGQTSMKKELESLRENHPKIQAIVFAANQAQICDQNPAFNKWIWQLRDAIDEADDVLDEFEYMKHKEQLTKNTEETKKRKVTSFIFEIPRKIFKIGERVLKMDPNLKRLEEAVQKLDKVSADVTTFLHLLDSAKQEQKEQEVDFYKTRETGYLPKHVLIGRRKEKELLMEWLRNPSNEHRGSDLYRNISLLSIMGHGGMGKTTLLQHVYKDEITKDFDRKMWVCVSNNFDVKKVIADMFECLKNERPRLETLVALQRLLDEEVMSKKFLLVLDDIWEEDEEKDKSKWEDVLAPLASGGFGSKILVTTRTDSVALMFAKVIKKKKEIVKLEGLEEDECLQLLNSHAFDGVENPDDHKRLRAIAGEIVKKLSGSPLAAKVIGGVLNSLDLDERRWRTVLESNLLGQNSIDSILRLSYVVLSNPLKSCFAFCGMFAHDHEFDKDDLIRMWIALGFIKPFLDQEESMEDIGGRYFDVLVKKSFFEKFDKVYENSSYYKMHDLLHELAQLVSIQECLRVKDSIKLPSIIPGTLRHLSVQTTDLDILRRIGKFKHLHSLFLFNKGSNRDLCGALTEIFKACRSLRLLYVFAKDLEKILEEIGNLIHLRYLKIDDYNLTRLPRSLSNLYHLQYIIFYSNWLMPWINTNQFKVDFLPSDINNLSNLRYGKLPGCYMSSICGIGKLKFLQELDMFHPRDESGYRIGELENMNDLCKLGITYFENVKDAEEACSAKLCSKRRLKDLNLCWCNANSWNIHLDENVLDNLQPPNCLRNLSISHYMGARCAIWMNNVNPIYNLEKIELVRCLECETLPPFGQLPFLKSLSLYNMPKVKWLESKFNGNDKYRAFPLLELLDIYCLTALEDWFEAGVAAEDGRLFPCLIELSIRDCPKLKELPSLPPMLRELPNLLPSLKRLVIWSCHPELHERYREDGGSDRQKIAHIPDIRIDP
ncbi:putative disease resistance protein RGA3 [Dendrobium catenatum]|uniref:putative disease resistance protein RGA3 n=1 Tax=Dendrobium catenatum TaxID=906689 RepID=UPI0009F1B8AB|nr:putative disease resistance protein RGA3 [Dendrobium catenatum]